MVGTEAGNGASRSLSAGRSSRVRWIFPFLTVSLPCDGAYWIA